MRGTILRVILAGLLVPVQITYGAVAEVTAGGPQHQSVTANPQTFSAIDTATLSASVTLLTTCMAFDQEAGMTVSAVQWNAVTMTAVQVSPAHNATGHEYAQQHYLVNPATGVSHNLSVTVNGWTTGTDDIYGGYIGWSGNDATNPIRSGSVQSSTTATVTITPSDAADSSTSCANTGLATPGTNQTILGSNGSGNRDAGMDRATTPAASVTHTWSGTANFAVVGFSVCVSGGTCAPAGTTMIPLIAKLQQAWQFLWHPADLRPLTRTRVRAVTFGSFHARHQGSRWVVVSQRNHSR